ncbi:MAG: AMP-binding protein [Candidatus Heimdallarchaeota archaeon]|nr:AMP-binding protein [Candidatus Heimdallarchaeota archaeon]
MVVRIMVFDKIKSFVIQKRLAQLRKKVSIISPSELAQLIPKLTWEKIRKVQKYNLMKTLEHAAEHSPFYRGKLSPLTNNLSLSTAFSSFKSIQWFTTPEAVSQKPEQFLAIPPSEVTAIHFSAGTTGDNKKIYLSKEDLGKIPVNYSLGFLNCGLTTQDVAQIMYSYGIWQLGSLYEEALRRLGILCLPVGNHVNFQKQESFIEEFGTSIITGTPSYVYNLAREIDLSSEARDRMKAILLGGERLSSKRRTIIESKLGGEVFMGYGLMEFGGGIASECKAHEGYHLFSNVLPEIVDLKTGNPVAEEEYGELVLTTLDREAMPLIRYRTGDITRFIEGDCECGLALLRIDEIKGRVDDRITIGTAEKYYPIVFDNLFDTIEEVTDYQLEVLRENGKDVLKLKVLTENPSKQLSEKITSKIYEITSLQLDIEKTQTLKEPQIEFIDNIAWAEGKRKRVIDRRVETF